MEAGFTVVKAQVEAMKARLFVRLRPHFQRRDHLRDIIRYRRKYLEMPVRHGEEEAAQVKEEYRRASAQTEQDYEETAAAMAEKKELSAEEEWVQQELHPTGFKGGSWCGCITLTASHRSRRSRKPITG